MVLNVYVGKFGGFPPHGSPQQRLGARRSFTLEGEREGCVDMTNACTVSRRGHHYHATIVLNVYVGKFGGFTPQYLFKLWVPSNPTLHTLPVLFIQLINFSLCGLHDFSNKLPARTGAFVLHFCRGETYLHLLLLVNNAIII
jgi:hypothetical protein